MHRFSKPRLIAILAMAALIGGLSPTSTLAAQPDTQLLFGTQPSNTAAGVTISPPVTVSVAFPNGKTDTSSTASVTIAIGTNPAAGTLSGTLTVAAVAGVATFSNLSINNPGTGYTLVATSSGLTSATSNPFNITPAGNHLVFLTQPGGGAAGAVWAQQPRVAVENGGSQVIATDQTTVITLSIGINPAGGSLFCAGGNSRTVVNGVASFVGCEINIGSASPYTLIATSTPAVTGATSAAFPITTSARAPVSISSATAPGNTRTGFSITTKITQVGRAISIRFEMSPGLANRTISVWIAKKINGVWTAFSPHASVRTDARGVAYYVYAAGSEVWESFQGRYAGDATTLPARAPARQARWVR
jgi:hypothetical protein